MDAEPQKPTRPKRGLARVLRQRAVAATTHTGLALARWLPARGVDAIEAAIAAAGPYLPVLARIVADNMRIAGVYSRDAVRAYFVGLATHFAGAMHVWRVRDPGASGAPVPPSMREFLIRRVALDPSLDPLIELSRRGQGAVLVGPHLSGYLIYLARLNLDLPLTAYMRPTRHEKRRALQERWMRTVGLRRLVDPDSNANPTLVMAGAVKRGGVVYITPDLPRKLDDGTPVRFLGREIYLPAGLSLIARRAGAPMYFLTARFDRGVCRLGAIGPYAAPAEAPRGERGQAAMQWFADLFARFLCDNPGMWYFWADKRWTRVLRGDPEYSRTLTPVSGDVDSLARDRSATTPLANESHV